MNSNLSKRRKKLKFLKEHPNRKEQKSKRGSDGKFEKVAQIINPTLLYKKIKYKNEIYNIDDCLLIRDPLVQDGYLIAKLLEIIPINGIEKYPYWPAIRVQW
jgi:hypothetical protein